MTAPIIEVGLPGLVVLIGAAGSGKTTLAARLFPPSEVLSSDALRAAVSGDAGDQRATRPAFAILQHEVGRRLAAGRLVVVDATNVERQARAALVRIAARSVVRPIAIVILAPAPIVHARNAARSGRVVPADVVDRHLARLLVLGPDPKTIAATLRGEGFAAVHVLATTDELNRAAVRRPEPAPPAPEISPP